jgi:hypothetical protein
LLAQPELNRIEAKRVAEQTTDFSFCNERTSCNSEEKIEGMTSFN